MALTSIWRSNTSVSEALAVDLLINCIHPRSFLPPPTISCDITEFKKLVRLRLQRRRKTEDLTNEDISLHLNMHQTDQLAAVEFGVTT